MGIDPGVRTGCKIAVVDNTGKVLETATVYPHQPRRDWNSALHLLGGLAKKHSVDLNSIGNGTASRETDKLAAALIKRVVAQKSPKSLRLKRGTRSTPSLRFASKELPDPDVSRRGIDCAAFASSAAELVKIDPESIGVGQYRHDVNQNRLARSLESVVEDCVNAAGVDVNTASVALLSWVSGLNAAVATSIVDHRGVHGVFKSRSA